MEVSMIRKGVVMMLIVTHVECNSPSKNLGQLSSKDSQEHGVYLSVTCHVLKT
ncbi:hypothetical protein MtrunA17_Chr2g0293701 [Medicago truncatula]|uniref:Uncharacterized protein n=1 Tax=Medicago truncatula TaxID=3880 RepID=A0A396J9P2_MEDTR|nr:hypothetical protein MtrunA17_Chr2g0293701 [Medicago truncatula]